MIRKILLLAIAVIQITLLGCEPKEVTPEITPERAKIIRRTIVAWLECEECEGGELEAVVKLGKSALPALISTLEGGASPAKIEVFKVGLTNNYRNLQEYAKTHPEAMITMNEEQYVKTYVGNYIAKYKTRSAIALGLIGGKEAREALTLTLEKTIREDVQNTIKESLRKIE